MQMVSAQKLYDSAFLDLNEERFEEAFKKISALLDAKPENGEFLYAMGCYFLKKKENAVAMALFKQAISVKPNITSAYNNIGFILFSYQKTNEARQYFHKSLKIAKKTDKSTNEAYLNLGASYIANGTPKKAIQYCNKVINNNPDALLKEQAENNLSLANLELGNYKKGFDLYEARKVMDSNVTRDYGEQGLPLWDFKTNERVVIYGEQGIGDEIMFGSCLREAMTIAPIIFDCHPRLMDIWRHSIPGLVVIGSRKENRLAWPKRLNPKFKLPLASLCKFLRHKESDFPKTPYLRPDRFLKAHYAKELSSEKIKVGISWSGGIPRTNSADRKTNLKDWLPILSQDFEFYSFEYYQSAEKEIEEFNKEFPDIKINHNRFAIDNYDHTVALADCMDLIISVPQSIVHVAGALGKKTWQLTPYRALWQMGPYGKDLPWYFDTKSFWQTEDQKWAPVFKKAGEELCKTFQKNT